MSDDWDDEAAKALCQKINRRITSDYNANLGQACYDFYKEEEFDEDGIREDIMDCNYPDGVSAMIDVLADKEVGKDVLSNNDGKNRFIQACKDAINDVPAPPPSVPIIVDIKDINFNLKQKEPKKAGEEIELQCPGVFDEKEDDAFKHVLAYGTKNNLPILVWLVDSYVRYKINRKYIKGINDYKTVNFEDDYSLFKNPSIKPKQQQKLKSSISSFNKRLVHEIELIPPQTYVDDDINKFIGYYTAMADAINIMLNENENQIAPCQIDMCIIPKNVNPISLDEDSEDEEGGDEDEREKIDLIGNLEYRLKEAKKSFTYEKFDDIDMNATRLSRFFNEKIVATLKNERKQRLIIYVDRRDPSQTDKMGKKYFESEYGQNDDDNKWDNSLLHSERKTTKKNWKDTVYIVRSTDQKYSELKPKYTAETSFWASAQNLIPRTQSCPSEKKAKEKDPFYGVRSDLNGYQFCLSWHIDSVNVIKTYWYHNAWGTRFFPIDALKLWPSYFQKVKNDTQQQTVKKDNKKKLTEMKQVIDPGFEKWYELTVGKDNDELIRGEWLKV